MERTIEYLTKLVRAVIVGEITDFPDSIDDQFKAVIKLARPHEIAHLAALAMLNFNLLRDDKNIEIAQKYVYEASYRDAKNNHTLELAEKTLEDAGIDYVPLKGAIIKNYYPERFMRTSCDVDILVHKADFKRAVSLFEDLGFCIDGDLNFHDISLLFDDSNLELHFSICENMKNMDAVLKDVWEYTEKSEGHKFIETNDYFVFHHIAHMAYHLLAGGCGIRPFVDLWILKRHDFFNEATVEEFCKKTKIYDFYKAINALIKVWFEGAEHVEITEKLEKYILTGGAYGYFPNNAAAYTVRNGGKLKYLFSIAFPPGRNMKAIYPAVGRHPVLLPAYYIYRLFEKTLGKNNQSAKKKYNIIKEQDSKFINEVASLIKELKLDK